MLHLAESRCQPERQDFSFSQRLLIRQTVRDIIQVALIFQDTGPLQSIHMPEKGERRHLVQQCFPDRPRRLDSTRNRLIRQLAAFNPLDLLRFSGSELQFLQGFYLRQQG
ncbi:hypothetical protein D3C81_1684480 [compost metagenome]